MKLAASILLVVGAVIFGAPLAGADISPELGAVPVDGTAYRPIKERYDKTATDLAASTSARTIAEAELARLAVEDTSLAARVAADITAKDTATTDLATARHNLKVVAITAYIRGNQDVDEVALDTADQVNAALDAQSRQAVFNAARGSQVVRAREAQVAHDAAQQRLEQGVNAQTQIRDQIADVTAARDTDAANEARLTTELAQRAVELADARATATVVGVDFTLVALDAYYRAAGTLAATRPQCEIPWWALAGIGRVESKHGRTPLATGDTSPPIIGIPLDGNNGTLLIPDTDGGELDGDIEFDRAVGPMQFIPTTWSRWASDGNDDGHADPHNMYDAALSAARYLCGGGPMQTDEELTRGFLRYNRSGEYAANVLEFAHQYAALVF